MAVFPMYQQPWPSSLKLSQHYMKSNSRQSQTVVKPARQAFVVVSPISSRKEHDHPPPGENPRLTEVKYLPEA